MSTTHKKRHFSEINDVSKEPKTKKRKTVNGLCEETAILEFTNLSNDILGDDVVYFIQKDYNIESKFFDPKFLELSRENAIKLVKQSPIDIDGCSFKCQLYDGKLPRRRKHNKYNNNSNHSYYNNNHNHNHNHNNNNHINNKKYNLYSKYKKFNKYNEPPEGTCGYTVWIGNITKKASKPYLISILEKFGEILNVYVLSQNSNHFNCAFVDFISPFDILAIGKAVFYRKLKIYDVPISIVLREKTIDKLFYNGYKKQLNQMINYGMLNIKHKEYYHKLCDKYTSHSSRSNSRHRSHSRSHNSHSSRHRMSRSHSHHSSHSINSHNNKASDSPYSTSSNTSTPSSNISHGSHGSRARSVSTSPVIPGPIPTVKTPNIIIKKDDEEFEDGEIKEEPEPGVYDETEQFIVLRRHNHNHNHGHGHTYRKRERHNNGNKNVLEPKVKKQAIIPKVEQNQSEKQVEIKRVIHSVPETKNLLEFDINVSDILKDISETFPELEVTKTVQSIGSFQDYKAVTNGFTSAVNENNLEVNVLKEQVGLYKKKGENVAKDLKVLSNCELIADHINALTEYNNCINKKMNVCDADINGINERYKMYNCNLQKNKLKLETMQREFIRSKQNNMNVLAKYNLVRENEWKVRENEIKCENMRLLNEFSLITEQVRNQTDIFERVDVEQKAKNARHSLLYHKIESKKKEIAGKEREYNKLYRDMEDEYQKIKINYESEQKQHKNTQKVLADTVSKVKESIKSINKRAQDKDLIIQRLQNRLKMYKNSVENGSNSNNSGNGS